MLTSSISLKNFRLKTSNPKIKQKLKFLFSNKSQIIESLSSNYRDSFEKKNINKYKSTKNFRLIGMGGSTLGTQAIYNFLKHKIKKKFYFIDNLNPSLKRDKKKYLNIVVSKSGNTIETITNLNVLLRKKEKNIFITENKKNYLNLLAQKLKADVIYHNNFIGGRYSVLSEVGMLPCSLIGLKSNKFKQFNSLIKKKGFIDSLVSNVANILYFIKKKKNNSIILNYDENSDDLFRWYQQLVGESLGKKQKGIFPFISTMPKDNHSLMQLYLDGPQKNFFTFFGVSEKKSNKIINSTILETFSFIKNKKFSQILDSQRIATQKVFNNMNIPFRSFEIKKRNEETLGELFTFFILETILLGKCLKINPYDQPAVELIKKSTKKTLLNF